ncbi:DUF1365 domain-containing protein [Mycolicibacterium sp. 050158]|uniref:DUF1365 domain-containing protein n=1 Tax=Mycolicibacterium sp. 050158 TaxID=3090602 RepID=UPI00299DB3F8|nr:DUF1365 family protein [Mycolicibacterium sp. 050158]MDX1890237.1 DUF1365 family protein [Mycolicibacterium sp. 050158]
MLTALYRTRITHLRRAPVHHYFEQRGYSWYVDIDDLPRLPRWLQPFARFEAADHLSPPPDGQDTLRTRVDHYLAERGVTLPGGTVTALLQARVLGYVFNPLSIFWCHDARGVLRHVIAEVHNTYGDRHAYLLPPTGDQPAAVKKALYVSPFNQVNGYYLVRAPLPDAELDVTISLHRENKPAFVATLEGARCKASIANILRLQMVAPVAPLSGALWIRVQGVTLWARRVPVVPRVPAPEREKVSQS